MTAPQGAQCRCGRCGADYSLPDFTNLAPIQSFGSEELAAHVVSWPEGIIVDVRACARCKTPIARLLRQAS